MSGLDANGIAWALAQALDAYDVNRTNERQRNPEEWRRDWIRRIATHFAGHIWEESQPTTDAGRRSLAWESTQCAAALWSELEKHFAAEAEQEGADDGDAGA